MPRFSERHGCQPEDAEITIRQGAPNELRGVVVGLANECGMRPSHLRSLVCRVLRRREDKNNWTEFPNVDEEVRGLLDECEWFEVYDVVEALPTHFSSYSACTSEGESADAYFEIELNRYFRRQGIGWQLNDGVLETRGSEEFQVTIHEAFGELMDKGRQTAANEIHEAIKDLSRRPQPDSTGAIQHAMAALECVARDATGDPKATLGTILQRYQGLLPKPLDQALAKLWGFASEQGRHLQEGREPGHEEAEVVVQVASAVARYLSKKSAP